MLYFKHISASGDDPDISDACALFKSDGYYVFFRTLEVMSQEFDVNNPGICKFSVPFLKKKFTVSWRKVDRILSFYHKRGRIIISFSDEDGLKMITLECPKLGALCDEYTQKKLKKVRTVSGHSPDSCPPIDLESDKDLELEKEETSLISPEKDQIYEKNPCLKMIHAVPMLRGITYEQFRKAKSMVSQFIDLKAATQRACDRAHLQTFIKAPGSYYAAQLGYYEKDHIEEVRRNEKKHRVWKKEVESMAKTINELKEGEQLERMKASFVKSFGQKSLNMAIAMASKKTNKEGVKI